MLPDAVPDADETAADGDLPACRSDGRSHAILSLAHGDVTGLPSASTSYGVAWRSGSVASCYTTLLS